MKSLCKGTHHIKAVTVNGHAMECHPCKVTALRRGEVVDTVLVDSVLDPGTLPSFPSTITVTMECFDGSFQQEMFPSMKCNLVSFTIGASECGRYRMIFRRSAE